MPEFDFSQLSAIFMALLGMSGLRSYDKLKELIQKDERYKENQKGLKALADEK